MQLCTLNIWSLLIYGFTIVSLLPTVHNVEFTKLTQQIVQMHFVDKPAGRILGGVKAVRGQIPYQVQLRLIYDIYDIHICAGSILTSIWVITAANCMRTDELSFDHLENHRNLFVVAGEVMHVDYQQAQYGRYVDMVIIHPQYDSTGDCSYQCDLALLRVDIDWDFDNPYVKPIKMLTFPIQPHVTCHFSGWGARENTTRDHHSVSLYFVDSVIHENEFCNKKMQQMGTYGQPEFIYTIKTLCAGEAAPEKNSICSGYLGAPLECSGFLAGVASGSSKSAGDSCGKTDVPDIFVNMNYYYPWIAQTMHENRRMPRYIEIEKRRIRNNFLSRSFTSKALTTAVKFISIPTYVLMRYINKI